MAEALFKIKGELDLSQVTTEIGKVQRALSKQPNPTEAGRVAAASSQLQTAALRASGGSLDATTKAALQSELNKARKAEVDAAEARAKAQKLSAEQVKTAGIQAGKDFDKGAKQLNSQFASISRTLGEAGLEGAGKFKAAFNVFSGVFAREASEIKGVGAQLRNRLLSLSEQSFSSVPKKILAAAQPQTTSQPPPAGQPRSDTTDAATSRRKKAADATVTNSEATAKTTQETANQAQADAKDAKIVSQKISKARADALRAAQGAGGLKGYEISDTEIRTASGRPRSRETFAEDLRKAERLVGKPEAARIATVRNSILPPPAPPAPTPVFEPTEPKSKSKTKATDTTDSVEQYDDSLKKAAKAHAEEARVTVAVTDKAKSLINAHSRPLPDGAEVKGKRLSFPVEAGKQVLDFLDELPKTQAGNERKAVGDARTAIREALTARGTKDAEGSQRAQITFKDYREAQRFAYGAKQLDPYSAGLASFTLLGTEKGEDRGKVSFDPAFARPIADALDRVAKEKLADPREGQRRLGAQFSTDAQVLREFALRYESTGQPEASGKELLAAIKKEAVQARSDQRQEDASFAARRKEEKSQPKASQQVRHPAREILSTEGIPSAVLNGIISKLEGAPGRPTLTRDRTGIEFDPKDKAQLALVVSDFLKEGKKEIGRSKRETDQQSLAGLTSLSEQLKSPPPAPPPPRNSLEDLEHRERIAATRLGRKEARLLSAKSETGEDKYTPEQIKQILAPQRQELLGLQQLVSQLRGKASDTPVAPSGATKPTVKPAVQTHASEEARIRAERLASVLGGRVPVDHSRYELSRHGASAIGTLRGIFGPELFSPIPKDLKDKDHFTLPDDPDLLRRLAGRIDATKGELPLGGRNSQLDKALAQIAETLRARERQLRGEAAQQQAGSGAGAGTGGGGGTGGGSGGGSGGGGKGSGTPPPDDDDSGETEEDIRERREKAAKKRLRDLQEEIYSHNRFLGGADTDLPDLDSLDGPQLLATLNRYDAAIRERVSAAEVFEPLAEDIGQRRGRAKVTNLQTSNTALETALDDPLYAEKLKYQRKLMAQAKLATVTDGSKDQELVDAMAATAVALKELRAASDAAAKATKEFAAAEFRAQKTQAKFNAEKQKNVLDEYNKANEIHQRNLSTLGPSHPTTVLSGEAVDQTVIGLRAVEAQTKRDIDIASKKRQNDLARAAGQPLPFEEAPDPTRFSKFLNRLRGRDPLEGSSQDPHTGGLRRGGGRGDFGGGGESLKSFFGQGIASGLKYGLPNMLLYGGAAKIGEIVRESAQLEVAFTKLEDQYDTLFGASGQAKVADLKNEIMDLAVETGQSAVELADAARQVNAAFGEGAKGPDGKDVALRVSSALGNKKTLSGEDLAEDQLDAVAKLARVSGQTIDATQDQARTLGFTFGVSASAIGDAAVYLEKLTSVPTGNLIRGLSDSAVSAKAAGFEFNEFAAVFASVERRSGARGVAGVADSFNRSLPVLTKNKEALIAIAQSNDKLGKNTKFWEGITKSKGSDILLGMAEVYDDLTKSQKDQIEALIGDPKSFKDLIAALQNTEEVQRAQRGLDQGQQEGGLDERAKKTLATLEGALLQFSQKIRTLGAKILQSGLGQMLTDAVQAGVTLLRVVEGIFGAISKVNDMTGGFLASFVEIVVVAKGLSMLLEAMAGKQALGGILSLVAGALGGGKAAGAAGARRPPLPPGVASFLPAFALEAFSEPRGPSLWARTRDRYRGGWANFMGLPSDALAEGQKRFWRWGAAAGPAAEGLTAAQRGGFGLGLSGIGSLGGISAGGLAGAALPAGLIAFMVGNQVANNYTTKQRNNWRSQTDDEIRRAAVKRTPGRDWASGWARAGSLFGDATKGFGVDLGFGEDPDLLDATELNRRRVERLDKEGKNIYSAIKGGGLSKKFAEKAVSGLGKRGIAAIQEIYEDDFTADSVKSLLEGGLDETTVDSLIKEQKKGSIGAEAALQVMLEGATKDKKLARKISVALKQQGVDASSQKALSNLESYFNSNKGRTLQATIDSYAIGETSASDVLKAYDDQIQDMENIINKAKEEGAEDVAFIEQMAQKKRSRMDFYSQQLQRIQATQRAIAGLESGFDPNADLQLQLDQAFARSTDIGASPELRQQAVSDLINTYQQILQRKLSDINVTFEEKMKILNEGLSIPEEQGRAIGAAKAEASMTQDTGHTEVASLRKQYELAKNSQKDSTAPDFDSIVAAASVGSEISDEAIAVAQKNYEEAAKALEAKRAANAQGKSKKGTTELRNKANDAKALLDALKSGDNTASVIAEAFKNSELLNRVSDAYADLMESAGVDMSKLNPDGWVKEIYGKFYAGGDTAKGAAVALADKIQQAEKDARAKRLKVLLSPFSASRQDRAEADEAEQVLGVLKEFQGSVTDMVQQAIEANEELARQMVQQEIDRQLKLQQLAQRASDLTQQIGAARTGGRNPFQNIDIQRQSAAAAERQYRNMSNLYKIPEVIEKVGEAAASEKATEYDVQAKEQLLRQLEFDNQQQQNFRDLAEARSEKRKSDLELVKATLGKRGSGVAQLDIDAQTLALDLAQAQEEQQFASSGGDEAGALRAAAQVNSIKAQIIENQRARRQAIRDLADAQSGLMKALADAAGDTVKSAQFSLKQAQDDLAEMLANPNDFSEVDVTNKRAEVVSNAAAVRDAQYRKSMDDIDFNLALEKITKTQAVAQLKAMRQLYANNEQITREIDRKIHELQKSSDLAFNLPDKLKLPTLYEVRRLSQTASAADPFTGQPPVRAGYTDNRQIDIKITVQDGTSKEEMVSILNDALQPNRRGFGNSQY